VSFNLNKEKSFFYLKNLTLFVSLLFFINSQLLAATSKSSDHRSAPIAIEADSAEQDEKKGVTIYRGNVSITQGDLMIKADTVTIQSTVNKTLPDSVTPTRNISNIIANGKPARFTQRLANEPKPINAQGNTIRYAIAEGIILLEDNASIDQMGSKVTGEKIEYFINEDRVKAQADPNDKSTRVHTIINPSKSNNGSQ
jgi:lipopolysaccharide export system protein LptA